MSSLHNSTSKEQLKVALELLQNAQEMLQLSDHAHFVTLIEKVQLIQAQELHSSVESSITWLTSRMQSDISSLKKQSTWTQTAHCSKGIQTQQEHQNHQNILVGMHPHGNISKMFQLVILKTFSLFLFYTLVEKYRINSLAVCTVKLLFVDLQSITTSKGISTIRTCTLSLMMMINTIRILMSNTNNFMIAA